MHDALTGHRPPPVPSKEANAMMKRRYTSDSKKSAKAGPQARSSAFGMGDSGGAVQPSTLQQHTSHPGLTRHIRL